MTVLSKGILSFLALACFVVASSAGIARADEPAGGPGGETTARFELPVPPEPPAGPVVPLALAVSEADARNRSLQAIREDLNVAAAKMQSSWAGLLPSLYGSVGYALSESASSTVVGGQTFTGNRNQLNAGLTLRVPLIQAREWLAIDSAKIETSMVEVQIEQARQVLLYSVAEAWYQAATALTLITVYQAQYDALVEHLRLAEARMDAGVGNIMDVRSAQTDLVSSWVQIVKAGYALADARDALKVLMGVDYSPMPQVAPAAAPGSSGGKVDPELLRAMGAPDEPVQPTAEAVGERWELKVLNKQTELLKSQLKSGYMPFVPSLDGFFNYDVDILGNDAIPGYDRDSWRLGLTLTVPIFDYTFFPGLAQSKAGIRQAELQVEQMELEGAIAIAEAARNVGKLGHMVAAQQVKAVLADDLLDLAEADYANGTGLAIEVTDARRTALSAHVDLATATWEYELGVLNLNREMGVDIKKALEGR